MISLPNKHPSVHVYLEGCVFSVKISSSNNPFGAIPVDQTLQKTVNKDKQTAGWTKRFNLKPAALQKYYLTTELQNTEQSSQEMSVM